MSKRGRDIIGPPAGHPDATQTRKQSRLAHARCTSGLAVRLGSDIIVSLFQFLPFGDAMQAIRVCRAWFEAMANTGSALRCAWDTTVPAARWHEIMPCFRHHIASLAPKDTPDRKTHRIIVPALGMRALQALMQLTQLRRLAVTVPLAKGPTPYGYGPCPPPKLETLTLAIELPPLTWSYSTYLTPEPYLTHMLQRLAPTTLRRLTIERTNLRLQHIRSSFSGLYFFPHLVYLNLEACIVPKETFTLIKQRMVELEELRLERGIYPEKLSELCSPPHVLTRLATLSIPWATITGATVLELARLPQLTTVLGDGQPWRTSTLSVCHLLPRIVDIVVGHCRTEPPLDLGQFKTYDLRHVESLELVGIVCIQTREDSADNPSADFFEAIAHMPRLRRLVMRACSIPDLTRLMHHTLKTVEACFSTGVFRDTKWGSPSGRPPSPPEDVL